MLGARPLALLALAAAAAWLAAPDGALAQGCAMCGTAVQDASDPLARSLSKSVLFMMSMPFVLFASVGGWLFLRHRRTGSSHDHAPWAGCAAGDETKENPS